MPHELEIVEDAVLAALSPLKGLGVRTIDAYAGRLDAVASAPGLQSRFPAVWVAPRKLSADAVNQVDLVVADLHILVGDRHARGPGSARRGDAVGPGVYAVLDAVRNILNGQPIIDQWSAFRWVQEEALVADQARGLCVFAALYRTRRAQIR
jgi:phage gp37-like protein